MRGLKNNHSHCTAPREEGKKMHKKTQLHCITKYKFEIDDEVPRTTSHFLIFLFLLFFPYSGIYLFQNAFPFCIRKNEEEKKTQFVFQNPRRTDK